MSKKYYPLKDSLSEKDLKSLGIEKKDYNSTRNIHAVWTGESRAPKKDEWFLSGALKEAYRAHGDLPSDYQILRLVRTKTVQVIEEI